MSVISLTKITFRFLILLLTTSVLAANPGKDSRETIVFGVAPFMSPLALVKRMSPLRDYLSETLDRPVIFETASHASDFLQRSVNDRYDYILTSPSFAVQAFDSGKFRLLAIQQKKLSGHIVVLKDSKIKKIEDLAGKTMGSPPEIGFLGQLIGPYLNHLGLVREKSVKIIYMHSHNDSILALIERDVDAVFIAGFMQKYLLDKGIEIREINRTEEFPGLTFLASKNQHGKDLELVQSALLMLHDTEKGRRVLGEISLSPFIEVEVNDLDIVRKYIFNN